MAKSSVDYSIIEQELGRIFDDYNGALLKELDETMNAAFEEIEKALTETDLTKRQQKTVMEIIKKYI